MSSVVMRPVIGLVAAILLTVGGASVTAQATEAAPNGDDEAKLRQCLEAVGKAESDPRACIGVVADPCLEKPGEATADGMLDCIKRELPLWERMLTDRLGDLVARVDDPIRDQVRQVHDTWIEYRDRRCSLGEVLFSGGSLATVWVADCILQETGRRAIEISVLLDEVNAR